MRSETPGGWPPELISRIIKGAAPKLGVPESQLSEPNNVVGEILDFFQTGKLNRTSGEPIEPEIVFKRARLISVGGTLLSVRAFRRYPHPLIPTVEEAQVHFRGEDSEQEVPPWKELTEHDDQPPGMGISWVFTSAVPVEENLRGFAHDI